MLRRTGTLPATVTEAHPAPPRAELATSVAEPGTVADAALVARAQSGDQAAFAQLVEPRLGHVYQTARAVLGNEADARDAAQDAMLRAWRERRQLRDPERFDAWLGRIVLNSCRLTLRGRRRRTVREIAASDVGDRLETVPEFVAAPDERSATLDLIERSFERLAVPERAVLVLHHLDEQPLAEIATTLGVPVGTVKSRLHAARQSLERAMEAELR